MSAVEDTNQERRITFCLYESWEKIAGSSGLPALKQLKREEIEAFKANLVLIDLRKGQDSPTFQVIGQNLNEDLEANLVGSPISDYTSFFCFLFFVFGFFLVIHDEKICNYYTSE